MDDSTAKLGSAPVFKAGAQSPEDPLEFLLSDETVDRAGDVIRASGWDLSSFKENPVCLFGHAHDQIIGTWKNVHVQGKKLMGTLNLAKRGTSDLVDTIHALVEQRILKACSVGFMPIEGKPRDKDDPFGGFEYTKSLLHEVSLVAVGCNPAALAIAKAAYGDLADQLFVRPDTTAAKGAIGRAAHTMSTPNLDHARLWLVDKGINLD